MGLLGEDAFNAVMTAPFADITKTYEELNLEPLPDFQPPDSFSGTTDDGRSVVVIVSHFGLLVGRRLGWTTARRTSAD